MKAMIRHVTTSDEEYDALMFCCPGCASTREGYAGLHMLPISGDPAKRPVWGFDGNLEAPTLTPSILTHHSWAGVETTCHSFLNAGVFQFLGDCTHELRDQLVPMPELPQWAVDRA